MKHMQNKNEGDGWNPSPSLERSFDQPTSENVHASYHDHVQLSRPAATSSATQNDHAVQLSRNGRDMVVGKILYRKRKKPFFYCQLRPGDVLVKLDAISVAPEVLDHLEMLGGSEVHLYAPWEGTLYVSDIDTIRAHARLASFHASIGKRYHLPRHFWKQTRLDYRVPYIEEVITLRRRPEPILRLASPEVTAALPSRPKPVQAGLFDEVVP